MRYMLIAVAAAAAAAAILPVATAVANPAMLAATAAAQGPTVTHDFLYGRWTDTNDCTNAIDFQADGNFVLSDGRRGRWTLEGDRLTFHGSTTVASRVRAPDANTITLTHADGGVGRSTRCAPRRAMPALPATAAQALAMSQPLLDSRFLIGTWTDNGDCGNVINFLSDGRFNVASGSGRWTLVGERLTFHGNAGERGARARRVGPDRIILLQDDGSIGQSIRC